MIISKTPFRFSLFGGGTDYPEWYKNNGALILAAGLDYYCYITYRNLPKFFEHKSKAVYSKIEIVNNNLDFEHPSIRETLRFCNVSQGIEIHHDSDVPARTGIGSSSSFTVGLLNAISAAKGNLLNPRELADSAIKIEQDLIGEKVGIQDQLLAAYGGLKSIHIDKTGKYAVKPLAISEEYVKFLEDNLLLGFFGKPRNSQDFSSQIVQKIQSSQIENDLFEVSEISQYALTLIESESDLYSLGECFKESWRLKCSLSGASIPENLRLFFDEAMGIGVLGGKLMGAGGAGAFYFLAPKSSHSRIKEHFKNYIKIWLPVRFSSQGSQVIFSENKLNV